VAVDLSLVRRICVLQRGPDVAKGCYEGSDLVPGHPLLAPGAPKDLFGPRSPGLRLSDPASDDRRVGPGVAGGTVAGWGARAVGGYLTGTSGHEELPPEGEPWQVVKAPPDA
jgi:hypothetical protein